MARTLSEVGLFGFHQYLQFIFNFIFHKTTSFQFKLTFNSTLAKQSKVYPVHTHTHTHTHSTVLLQMSDTCNACSERKPDTYILKGASLEPTEGRPT